eukprot:6206429-Pleurochrysis_carterae.AAC.2
MSFVQSQACGLRPSSTTHGERKYSVAISSFSAGATIVGAANTDWFQQASKWPQESQKGQTIT